MKRLAAAGLTAAALATATVPVFAADLPQPVDPAPYDTPVPAARFDWGGAYIGGNLGWTWSKFTTTSAPTGKFDTNTNGVSGGVHAGYNFVISPNVVAGVEADLQLSDTEKTLTRGGVAVKTSSSWNSSFRGRLGYTFDRFMVYGTGGLAIADISVNAGGAKNDATAVGWTAGAGIESAITQNVTARVEYAYQDFGAQKFTVGGSQYKTSLDNSQVRFGLSYKF